MGEDCSVTQIPTPDKTWMTFYHNRPGYKGWVAKVRAQNGPTTCHGALRNIRGKKYMFFPGYTREVTAISIYLG